MEQKKSIRDAPMDSWLGRQMHRQRVIILASEFKVSASERVDVAFADTRLATGASR